MILLSMVHRNWLKSVTGFSFWYTFYSNTNTLLNFLSLKPIISNKKLIKLLFAKTDKKSVLICITYRGQPR